IEEIRSENKEMKVKHGGHENVFKTTSVFKITGKGKDAILVKETIEPPSEITKETNNKKVQKMGLEHLDRLIAAYTKLCDQYEANTTTLGKLIGKENYLHALSKRQELRAKRSEFYIGQ